MIRIVSCSPILIGYYRPHNKIFVKERVEQVQRKVSIDVSKKQIHIYEQEEHISNKVHEEDDTNQHYNDNCLYTSMTCLYNFIDKLISTI